MAYTIAVARRGQQRSLVIPRAAGSTGGGWSGPWRPCTRRPALPIGDGARSDGHSLGPGQHRAVGGVDDQPFLLDVAARPIADVGPQELAVRGEGRRATVRVAVVVVIGVLGERRMGLGAHSGGPTTMPGLPPHGTGRIHGSQRVHAGEHGNVTRGRDCHRAVPARPGRGEADLRPVPVEVADGQFGVPALQQQPAPGPVQHLGGVRRRRVERSCGGGHETGSDLGGTPVNSIDWHRRMLSHSVGCAADLKSPALTGFLHRVFGLTLRAQHPVCRRE
jgi:hypothetical protein